MNVAGKVFGRQTDVGTVEEEEGPVGNDLDDNEPGGEDPVGRIKVLEKGKRILSMSLLKSVSTSSSFLTIDIEKYVNAESSAKWKIGIVVSKRQEMGDVERKRERRKTIVKIGGSLWV